MNINLFFNSIKYKMNITNNFNNIFNIFRGKNKVNNKINSNINMEDNKIIKWEDTLPFKVPITGGQVIKVYDGDTITIASKLPFENSPLYRFSVRLNGIDTPEIKTKNEDEKTVAKQAKEALSELIMNKYVTLQNIDSEKYGRILADVYVDNICVNEWLINNRFAVKYNGGTKNSPPSWIKYKESGIY